MTSGFKQPACENKHVCAHKCERALRLASTKEDGVEGSSVVNVVGVRDARNLPVGEIWQETAVRETITGAPAHGAHTKSRVMTCVKWRGWGIGKQERGVLQCEKNGNSFGSGYIKRAVRPRSLLTMLAAGNQPGTSGQQNY